MTDLYDPISQLRHLKSFAFLHDPFTIEESLANARLAAWEQFGVLTGLYPTFHNGRWGFNVGSGARTIIPPKYTGVRSTMDLLYSLCMQMELPRDVIVRLYDSMQSSEQECDAAKLQLKRAMQEANRPLRYDDFDSPQEYFDAKAERDGGTFDREREAVDAFDDRREPPEKKRYTPPTRPSIFGGPPSVPPQSPYASPDMPPCRPLDGEPAHPATLDERRKLNEKLSEEMRTEDAEKARIAKYAATDERKTNGIKYAQGFGTNAPWIALPLACFRIPSVIPYPKYNAPWTQCD